MALERPTFNESWYRVADLRPSLRATVQIHRQHYRGQLWHVVSDPANNQHFRLNQAAYHFVAMLDGTRTVAQAWQASNESLGDSAPTQGEAISLLGQLYTGNLLYTELPGDAESLFARYKKRRVREAQGYLMNLLFVRIPLLDPDAFLDRWVGLFGRVFSIPGLVCWAAIILAGLWSISGRIGDLLDQGQGVLDHSNLPLLYVSFILCKVLHEFAHAFACKKLGRSEGGGGEVHQMGIMLLVFMPMPYVDASSSWILPGKWHRAVVGAGGMFVETAVGAIAAIVWANTAAGTTINALAYNMIFIAGVTTLVFNANPLLRYDGYYILSDLLEMPNLSHRSREYLTYLIRRYAYGVKPVQTPARTGGERYWLGIYGVASTIYRFFICTAIVLFVASKFFVIGVLMALAAVATWLLVPLGKVVHYLAVNNELARTRTRAVALTLVAVIVPVMAIATIPVDDNFRIEGVVYPVHRAYVHAGADGFVSRIAPSGSTVSSGSPLVQARNPDIEAALGELKAQRDELVAKRRIVLSPPRAHPRTATLLAEQIEAHDRIIEHYEERLAALEVVSPLEGMWVSPIGHRLGGAFIRQGDLVGEVVSLDKLIIQAAAGQDCASLLLAEECGDVSIRVRNRPDIEIPGRLIERHPSAGTRRLSSPALGVQAGGTIRTSPRDEHGTLAQEPVFEFRIECQSSGPVTIMPGQRVVARFSLPPKPLVRQWYRSLTQLLQRRFHI